MWRLRTLRQSSCSSLVRSHVSKRYITIGQSSAIDVKTTSSEFGNSSAINREPCDTKIAPAAVLNRSAQTPSPETHLLTSKNMETISTELGNVAHTASVLQGNGEFRAKDIVSLEGKKTSFVPTNPIKNGNVVFVFTGSASQFDGMGKQLYETSPFVRQLFQEHDEICRNHNLPSFIDLITQNDMTFASASPIQTQLAIVSFDLVMANLWQHWGIQPNAVTGFSLGQFPALVIAGVISPSDMFFLVGKRAEMMVKECTAGTHAMVATFGITASQTQDLLQQMPDLACDLACISATKMMAICGPRDDVHILSQRLTDKGIRAVPLDVPYAFHSAQMDPVLEKFHTLAETVSYEKPRIPYASTLLGQVVTEGGIIGAKSLTEQTRQVVNMEAALLALKEGYTNENTTWIECGPQGHILMMIASTLQTSPDKLIASSSKADDGWTTITAGVKQAYNNGLNINRIGFQEEYESALEPLDAAYEEQETMEYWREALQ